VVAILAVIAYAGILLVLQRIWRMGVVSDRSAAAMFLFNVPVLVTAILFFSGTQLWVIAVAGLILFAAPLAFYRTALNLLADARATSTGNTTFWDGLPSPARWTIMAVGAGPSILLVILIAWLRASGRI